MIGTSRFQPSLESFHREAFLFDVRARVGAPTFLRPSALPRRTAFTCRPAFDRLTAFLAIRRFPMPLLQIIALVLYTVEWVRTTWVLISFRMEAGIAIHPAIEILCGVTVFTLCSTLVFRSSAMRR